MKVALLCPEIDGAPIRYSQSWRLPGNFVQHFCTLLDGDYWLNNAMPDEGTLARLDEYDVVLINQNTTQYKITVQLAETLKHCKVVGFQDGSAEDITVIPHYLRGDMIRSLRAMHMFLVYQEWAPHLFSTLTDKPVRYVGFPVSLDAIRQYALPADQREEIVILGSPLGHGGASFLAATAAGEYMHFGGHDRNGVLTAFAVQKALPGVRMSAIETGWHPPIQAWHEQEGEFAREFLPALEMHLGEGQDTYWRRIARCKLAVHLDMLHTFGRFAIECALVGTPCIGTPYNGTQSRLWPDLCFHPFMDMDKVVEKIRELWGNSALRYQACYNAQAALPHFSEGAVVDRFRKAVAEIGVQ